MWLHKEIWIIRIRRSHGSRTSRDYWLSIISSWNIHSIFFFINYTLASGSPDLFCRSGPTIIVTIFVLNLLFICCLCKLFGGSKVISKSTRARRLILHSEHFYGGFILFFSVHISHDEQWLPVCSREKATEKATCSARIWHHHRNYWNTETPSDVASNLVRSRMSEYTERGTCWRKPTVTTISPWIKLHR